MLLFRPPSCPQAPPLARVFGEGHDQGTRTPQRTRLEEVVGEVECQVSTNGPWLYRLSQPYHTLTVTTAVQRLAHEQQVRQAA